MAGLDRKFFRNWAATKSLALAGGIWLALPGTAFAVDCSETAPTKTLSYPSGIASIDAADRPAIMDLIHSYAWTLDDKDYAGFPELFTDNATYEACNGGGTVQIFKTTSKADLTLKIKRQFDGLTDQTLQTRHFMANTVLSAKDKITVEAKITMLVTIQAGGETATPAVDYTAVLKGTLSKDETANVWKFSKLTLFTDLPEIQARAR